jgi:hypothetical protein
MRNAAVPVIMILVALLLLVAGCSTPQPPSTPTPTPIPTTIPVVTPEPTTAPVGLGTPGPTQTLPPQYAVAFQVTPNGRTSNPLTYVALQGGNGMNFIAEVEIILTEPDGTEHTEYMRQPLSMGQNVAIPCSTTKNRVEIWVTAPTVGKVKVYDQIVPFQSINPSY